MKIKSNQIRAALLGAAIMLAMAVALKDQSVAFALGVAAFVAFGGLSSRKGGDHEQS